VTEEIFYDWLDKIWLRTTAIKSVTGTLLIYDRAKLHFSDRINYLLKKNNTKYALIPPGQISYLQLLDASINKPFKDYICDKFLEFQLKNKNSRPPSKEELLQFVHDVWYDPKLITEEIILKYLKYVIYQII
jgi:hypothetical protein